jgi:hypothetical protein
VKIVGIDPGKTGAIAFFIDGEPAAIRDMPIAVDGIDGRRVSELLSHWEANEVYIERSHAMAANGSKAAYSQGDSNGALRTAAHMAKVPLIWVPPMTWQRHAGLAQSGLTAIERKRRSRMRAMELFPTMADYLNRAKDHNRAEALLIGRYGVQTSITSAVLNA